METVVTITLIVKGDRDEVRDKMESLAVRTLFSNWFCEDAGTPAPYPTGSLLWYGIAALDKKLTPSAEGFR